MSFYTNSGIITIGINETTRSEPATQDGDRIVIFNCDCATDFGPTPSSHRFEERIDSFYLVNSSPCISPPIMVASFRI